jgi:hypothetical protein
VDGHARLVARRDHLRRRVLQVDREVDLRQGGFVEAPGQAFNSSLQGNTRRAIDIHEGEEVDAGAFKALISIVVRADRGAVPAGALRELRGARPVAEQALTFSRLVATARPVLVNGAAGVISWLPTGEPFSVMGFMVRRGKIVEIDILADPARLRQLDLRVLDDLRRS